MYIALHVKNSILFSDFSETRIFSCFNYQLNTQFFYSITIYMLHSALIRPTVQPFTESDDTRCCDNAICPPEDGHVDARNVSRIVM